MYLPATRLNQITRTVQKFIVIDQFSLFSLDPFTMFFKGKVLLYFSMNDYLAYALDTKSSFKCVGSVSEPYHALPLCVIVCIEKLSFALQAPRDTF